MCELLMLIVAGSPTATATEGVQVVHSTAEELDRLIPGIVFNVV